MQETSLYSLASKNCIVFVRYIKHQVLLLHVCFSLGSWDEPTSIWLSYLTVCLEHYHIDSIDVCSLPSCPFWKKQCHFVFPSLPLLLCFFSLLQVAWQNLLQGQVAISSLFKQIVPKALSLPNKNKDELLNRMEEGCWTLFGAAALPCSSAPGLFYA